MKKSILTGSHLSRLARFLTQIGYRIALAATALLALGSAQLTEAQTTIQVTTAQQGVTDASHCSLQEAIYAAEFGSNTALNLTDPDRFYTTGCVLQGASGPFTIVLQKTVYSFDTFWDRDAHNPFGLTATPIIFANITIQGNGATLQWTGTGNSDCLPLEAQRSSTRWITRLFPEQERCGSSPSTSRYSKSKAATERAEAAEVSVQGEPSMLAWWVPASQLSTLRTAPSIPTSPLAAMAATPVASPLMVLVAVAVACPAMAGLPAVKVEAAVALAPEDTVGMDLVEVEAVQVARSSMAQTVSFQGAPVDTSAVEAAAAARVTAMEAFAPAAAAVEEDRRTWAS